MKHRRMSAVPVLLVVTLALVGCVATPVPTPSASSPATPSQTASAEPTTEPSAAQGATCDTVLTADAYANFATNGQEPLEPPAADHLATVYPLAAQMVEAGGLACSWGAPQSEATLVVRLSDADWGVWEPALADAGFVETNDPVPGAYTGPVDPGTGVSPVVVVMGDTLTFVEGPMLAGWVAPTS